MKIYQRMSSKKKTLLKIIVGCAALTCLANVVNDHALFKHTLRKLCETNKDEANDLIEKPRGLASSIVQYIDEALNGEELTCDMLAPPVIDPSLAYPPLTYFGGPIPNRPEGTIAFVNTIIGCPEWYNPDVVGTPDPGDELYEATAVLKTELCDVVDLHEMMETDSDGKTLYSIVNPNGVTCPVPGKQDELYDRVAMLKEMGFRVEIVGQPITNLMLQEAGQDYISEMLETDVGIRDSTRLHAFRLVEHPVAVMYDYDMIFQYKIFDAIDALQADPNVKGYYVRTPDCGGGNTLVDTSLMIIKPSMDEFNKIIDTYLNTPYDPATGWNGEGHNQCDGKLGLPGFLSYYFSKDPAYVELDRCKYAFAVDDTCLNIIVQDDALISNELGRTLLSNGTDTDITTDEALALAEAIKNTDLEPVQVNILPTSPDHPKVEAVVEVVDGVATVQLYVQVKVSVEYMVAMWINGEMVVHMHTFTQWVTTIDAYHSMYISPQDINNPDLVNILLTEAMVRSGISNTAVLGRNEDICGKASACPTEDPSWSLAQRLACDTLHHAYFEARKKTDLATGVITEADLTGAYKPEVFLGYCNGNGIGGFKGTKYLASQ